MRFRRKRRISRRPIRRRIRTNRRRRATRPLRIGYRM